MKKKLSSHWFSLFVILWTLITRLFAQQEENNKSLPCVFFVYDDCQMATVIDEKNKEILGSWHEKNSEYDFVYVNVEENNSKGSLLKITRISKGKDYINKTEEKKIFVLRQKNAVLIVGIHKFTFFLVKDYKEFYRLFPESRIPNKAEEHDTAIVVHSVTGRAASKSTPCAFISGLRLSPLMGNVR